MKRLAKSNNYQVENDFLHRFKVLRDKKTGNTRAIIKITKAKIIKILRNILFYLKKFLFGTDIAETIVILIILISYTYMIKKGFIFFFSLLSVLSGDIFAQKPYQSVPLGEPIVWIEKNGKDTMLVAYLSDLNIYPPEKFKNSKQEQFYWITVRDVKFTLPYAKLIAYELNKTNKKLASLPDDKERKKYLSQYEKEILKKYEPELKKMNFNQGKMLLKLIDRECNQSPYELIRAYRGSFTAFFWQGIARIFGTNLKTEYDGRDKDKIVERIIVLVEGNRL